MLPPKLAISKAQMGRTEPAHLRLKKVVSPESWCRWLSAKSIPRGDFTRSRGIFTSRSNGFWFERKFDWTYHIQAFHPPTTAKIGSHTGIVPATHANEKRKRSGICCARTPKNPANIIERKRPREMPNMLPTLPSMKLVKLSVRASPMKL